MLRVGLLAVYVSMRIGPLGLSWEDLPEAESGQGLMLNLKPYPPGGFGFSKSAGGDDCHYRSVLADSNVLGPSNLQPPWVQDLGFQFI